MIIIISRNELLRKISQKMAVLVRLEEECLTTILNITAFKEIIILLT